MIWLRMHVAYYVRMAARAGLDATSLYDSCPAFIFCKGQSTTLPILLHFGLLGWYLVHQSYLLLKLLL